MKSLILSLIAAAIILVIAFMLFPVFAQSKESAKKTQALSERKMRETQAALEAEERGLTLVGRDGRKSLMDERMVIRTADLTVRVDSVEKAEQAVSRIVREHGGYVTETRSSDLASEYPSMTITMRVPVGSFDQILTGVEGLGTRLTKGISSQDVTEQVVDLDARIRTMSIQEETFRGLLKDARSLNAVIALQDRLTGLRSEIESLQAQRTSLSKQAAYSTVTLTLEQAAVGPAPAKDPDWLAQAWGEATTTMGAFTRSLTVLGVWLLVFSPVWVFLAFMGMKVRKATQLKHAKPGATI
jgi:hypothetical protein